jgi:transposase
MSSIKLSKTERSSLKEFHRSEHNRKAADRIKTVLLLDEGLTYSRVAEILLLDNQTVSNYEKRFLKDGVHPTHNVQPQYGWILKGTDKEIRTNTGRQRVNINGALCFHTLDVIYREDQTINRLSTLNLLEQIRSVHDARIPIRVVLDNAPYNKVSEVREYASANNIKLMFLPSYSPNLNLIERLWRFFKDKICTKYYEKFQQFRNAVLKHL